MIMSVRRLLGAIAIVGGGVLVALGSSSSASAVGICFNGLTTGFVSPNQHSRASFTPDHTGINASSDSGVSILSITLHFADGTNFATTYPAHTTAVVDVHATPRQVIATYDICKDEPLDTTTVAPTTAAPTTTAAATTAPPTVAPTSVTPTTALVTTTGATSPELSTTPTTSPPPSGSVLGTTIAALPSTGSDQSGPTYAAAICLILGGSLLLLSRREPSHPS
jgi:LPXTG-motif cell wall-anchored protein